MSSTKVRLLEAASEAAGGTGSLALRLGISHAMLRKYLSGAFPLPDPLLLRALDFILVEREKEIPFVHPASPASFRDEHEDV
jgi:hypothetical protein